jgi:ribosomal protein L15
MPKTGANSADFGLTFIAGRLSAQLEKGGSIDVMSNDTAMSYAVELLGQIGIQSTHIKQLAEPVKIEQSQLAVQEIKIKPKPQIEVNVDKKVLQLLAKNQPKKPKSLLKSLMSWCNLNLQQAEILLEKLQQIKVVVIEQNKCEYNKKELKKALGQGNLNTTSPRLTMTEIELRPHLMRIKQYCDYLSKVTNNKPSKIDTLSNSIKALFKFEKDEHVQQMINLLKKHQIIQLNAQKIVYLQSNIDIWSTIK